MGGAIGCSLGGLVGGSLGVCVVGIAIGIGGSDGSFVMARVGAVEIVDVGRSVDNPSVGEAVPTLVSIADGPLLG